MQRSAKKAFTLAELMITLSIIGVLAAMTLPGVIQDIQNQEMFTAFKKVYADLDAAANKIKNDNGGDLINLTSTPLCQAAGQTNPTNADGCYMRTFANYLNVTNTNWTSFVPKTGITTLKGSPNGENIYYSNASILLQNGVSLGFQQAIGSGGGAACTGGNALIGSGINMCGMILVDANGRPKGPNRIGRDIFIIYFSKDEI